VYVTILEHTELLLNTFQSIWRPSRWSLQCIPMAPPKLHASRLVSSVPDMHCESYGIYGTCA